MKIIIEKEEHLPQVAKDILALAGGKKLFAFSGPLGAGKTTIIKAICNYLGARDIVTSPSFTIVNEYKTLSNESLFHIDLFRIKSINEAFDFGIEEYIFSNNYCFIEWPELIEDILPDDTVKIKITVDDEGRRILEFE
ncbi:MAG: tRNA (adenosine(37)-N6)-threonylcarbamoyltransferase complex ATPase subunit type 1 TsaE [Bacteroidales bacterium]|nr:tRNA (adenosine(37)-N6)-threonylcarbamoyltransferase complex ATPase subunit type 1 TsaE [Bacteroidales bacterium]HCI55450.1 tRNA (adenosine(37)-N6)-threonylcarbamoyltransferase complex ATPase subunit type 1 TsaE [Bacteroidales bacterium]